MICKKCGANVPNGAIVCSECGGMVDLKSAQQHEIEQAGGFDEESERYNRYLQYVKSKAPEAQKRVFSSLFALVSLIIFTLSIIILPFTFCGYFTDLGFIDTCGNDAGSFFLVLTAFVPSIIIAVGMWLVYASAKNPAIESISTKGISICRVAVIIRFALLGTAVIAYIINSVFIEEEFTNLLTVILSVPVITGLNILVMKEINEILSTAETGILNPQGVTSAAMVVSLLDGFIFGFFGVLMLIISTSEGMLIIDVLFPLA